MKKIIYLFMILFSIFITSCEMEQQPTETYITNISVNEHVVTWDVDPNGTNYYILVNHSFTSSAITFTSEENQYDLSLYIKDLQRKYNGFTLTIKVKSNSPSSVYKDEVEIIIEEKIIELSPAPTPSNVQINDTSLSWDKIENINNYEIELDFNNEIEIIYTRDNTFNFSGYLNDEGIYSFRVKAIKSDSYSSDSEYSNPITYEHKVIQIEKEIFSYNFTTNTTLPAGFGVTVNERYADNSIKFNKSKFFLTTPTFTAQKSFQVTALIKGNGCTGEATITFYGLDANNNVLEKQEFIYTIQNSKYELTAEFTNTNIVKIKLEYTTKATGNFGLYTLTANHDEESDKVTSFKLTNYKQDYQINDTFNYQGTLQLNYKSGATKEIDLNAVKDQVSLSNFTTTTKGHYTATLTYLGVSSTFNYIVVYDYEALYEYADNVNIYTVDINDDLNNLFTILSLVQNDKEINILFDYNKQIDSLIVNQLQNELSKYLNSEITYFYSVNNENLFANSGYNKLTMNEYNFAPDVDLYICDNYYEISVYGYSYYFSLDDLDTDHKVDILQLNSAITSSELEKLDPECIILQEGSINDFINTGMLVYQTDDEIFQYAPTLNKTLYYSFTETGYVVEGNDTELSNHTIWSDSQTNGLHHSSIENYLYRKSYYGDIENLYGEELVLALRNLLTTTQTYAPRYGDAKTMFAQTDADPLKPGNIIMIYTGDSISSKWDNGITWNREHVWPKSLSGGLYTSMSDSDRNAGSDLHHIRPAITSINSSRGNKMYGAQTTEKYFYPGDNFTGDTARILFYLSVRYNMDILNLKVADDLSLLLSWNSTDVVDNLERNRNNAVQDIQGNYNPFIDNPWLADRIWK